MTKDLPATGSSARRSVTRWKKSASMGPTRAGLLIVGLLVTQPRSVGAQVEKAVVKVLTLKPPLFAKLKGKLFPFALTGRGYGSGVVIDERCVVVTNNHVVKDAIAVAVRFEGVDRVYAAKVAHRVKEPDLALLVVDRPHCAPFVRLDQPSPSLARRSKVFKVGYGGGISHSKVEIQTASVKDGVISRVIQMQGKQRIEISNPINPGDSGGLVHDTEDRIVGISVGRHRKAEGVGYVIPALEVQRWVRSARRANTIGRARQQLVGKSWPSYARLALVGAKIVETPADRLKDASAANRQAIEQLLESMPEPSDVRREVRLLLYAFEWNDAVLLVYKGVKQRKTKQRQKGCSALNRLVVELRGKAASPAGRRQFVDKIPQVFAQTKLKRVCARRAGIAYSSHRYHRTRRLQRRYGSKSWLRSSRYRRTSPSRSRSSLPKKSSGPPARPDGQPCKSKDDCRSRHCHQGVCKRYADTLPRQWRFLAGKKLTVDLRWMLGLYFGPEDGYNLANFGVTFGLPIVGYGRPSRQRELALSLTFGYALSHIGDEIDTMFHRLELPVRIQYRYLFFDGGPLALFYDVDETTEAAPGFLLRLGMRETMQAGVEYLHLPLTGGAKTTVLRIVGFFLGVGF